MDLNRAHTGSRRFATALLLVPLGGAAGCSSPAGIPTWAANALWIEPGPEGSIHGFEKWQVYREEWVDDRNEKYYLCAVVFEFEGTPTADACAGCSESWAVATEFSETDCDESTAASPAFATLSAIGLGEVDPDLPLETPFDEALGSWARFGDTAWESHGWAYPSVAGQGGEPPQWNWNSSQPFDLIPAWTWPLDEQTP